MQSLNSYFDKIFCINLDHRTDRWLNCQNQFDRFGITAERFRGYEKLVHDGIVHGNFGCTSSHRALLEIINYNKWERTLILEDDFQILHEDFCDRFDRMIHFVPNDWDMLYLGGHYGEAPKQRINPNVIRMARMLTTSSYAVTLKQAIKMAPYICGPSPIDSLYGGWHLRDNCYILQPRLMVQYGNFSDIQLRHMDNSACMTDARHENMV